MKNLAVISFFTVYIFTNVIPTCSGQDPISFVSGIITIVAYISSLTTLPPSDHSYAIVNAMNQFSVKLSDMQKQLEDMYEHIPRITNFQSDLRNYHLDISYIDTEFDYMLEIAKDLANGTILNDSDKSEMLKKAENSFSTEGNLFKTIKNIYNSFVKSSSASYKFIEENMQGNQKLACTKANQLESHQQMLLNLYGSIVVSYAKVHTTIKIAANYTIQTKGELPDKSYQIVMKKLKDQYKDTVNLMKQLIPNASRDVWACDPKPHIENTTFIKPINVFQKQIVGFATSDGPESMEVLFHESKYQLQVVGSHLVKDIADTLRDAYEKFPLAIFLKLLQGSFRVIDEANKLAPLRYYDAATRQTPILKNLGLFFDNNPRCQGQLRVCEPLSQWLTESEDNIYRICHSKNDTKRFDRMEVQTIARAAHKTEPTLKAVFGQQTPCDENHISTFIGNLNVCTCDETESDVPTLVRSNYSYRYFYTGRVLCTLENCVVTGARLGYYKGIIYPIIQQGKLYKNGVIDTNSIREVDLKNNLPDFLMQKRNLVKIDWNDRTLKLGEVELPSDRVLVGLSFKRINSEVQDIDGKYVEGPLRLVLRSRRYNFTTGELYPDRRWHDVFTDGYKRRASQRFNYINSKMVNLDNSNADLPDLYAKSSAIEDDKYLNFTTSNFQTDIGQTTVPYFDVQNVTLANPLPISGAGLYYKYRPGHAGFIGIKLKTYDMTQYINQLNDTFPEAA